LDITCFRPKLEFDQNFGPEGKSDMSLLTIVSSSIKLQVLFNNTLKLTLFLPVLTTVFRLAAAQLAG